MNKLYGQPYYCACEDQMEHVFVADTNLFFEFKRLEDIPWSDLNRDPVVIALTKPVLAEIDRHKRGSGKTRKRAIEISGRIRKMLDVASREVVIQKIGPRVVLRNFNDVKPDPDLAGQLDYNSNDDKIVGTVATLLKHATYTSVSMLTDDSIAASTAQGLGISFILIPESWRRPPEETEEAKKIKKLEKDLLIYKAQEPSIIIEDASISENAAHVVRRVALAIEPSEVDQLIGNLKTRHPAVEAFAPPEAETQADGTVITYEAPDAETIGKYSSETYPKWIDACRSIFVSLHGGRTEPEAKVSLKFRIKNDGTRPALKMRVSFEAKGNINLVRGGDDPDNVEDKNYDHKPFALPAIPTLPAAPVAPMVRRIVERPPSSAKGFDPATLRMPGSSQSISLLEMASRERASGLGPQLSAMHNSKSMLNSLQGHGALLENELKRSLAAELIGIVERQNRLLAPHMSGTAFASPTHVFNPASLKPLMPFTPPKHDREGFYFDQWQKGKQTKLGALTCDLFRHKRSAEFFAVDVLFPEDGNVTGAVECTVEAENLTEPVPLTISVSRKVDTYSLMSIADEMVERCGR